MEEGTMSIRGQIDALSETNVRIAGKIKEARKADKWQTVQVNGVTVPSRKDPNSRLALLQTEYDSNEARIGALLRNALGDPK
jgi:uncharacterized protein YfaP (DUF2135 family)